MPSCSLGVCAQGILCMVREYTSRQESFTAANKRERPQHKQQKPEAVHRVFLLETDEKQIQHKHHTPEAVPVEGGT